MSQILTGHNTIVFSEYIFSSARITTFQKYKLNSERFTICSLSFTLNYTWIGWFDTSVLLRKHHEVVNGVSRDNAAMLELSSSHTKNLNMD